MPEPVVLRADLDFSPWDDRTRATPAGWLRLAELARNRGWVVHAFATARCVVAVPAIVEAVLGEGHELDWWWPDGDFDDAWESFHAASPQSVGAALDAPGGAAWPEALRFSVGAASGAPIAFDGHEAVRWSAANLDSDPDLLRLEASVADALSAGRALTTYRRLADLSQ